MDFTILIIVLLLILLILAKIYDFKLKHLKEFAENEELKYNDIIKKYPSNLEEYLLNEIGKLKKLLEDYDIQISQKQEDLQKLNEEYSIKEEEYLNNIKNCKE